MKLKFATSIALLSLTSFAAKADAPSDPIAVNLKSPVSSCLTFRDSVFKNWKGYAYPNAFGGDKKKDHCVKIVPTDRGDTLKVYIGKDEGHIDKLAGTLFGHSLATMSSQKSTGSLMQFSPADQSKRTKEFFGEISDHGFLLVDAVDSGLGVAFWVPVAEIVNAGSKK